MIRLFIHFILMIFCAVLIIIRCNYSDTEKIAVKNPRIKLIEVTCFSGSCYSIIEVDGKEYLSRSSGSIVEIEK